MGAQTVIQVAAYDGGDPCIVQGCREPATWLVGAPGVEPDAACDDDLLWHCRWLTEAGAP